MSIHPMWDDYPHMKERLLKVNQTLEAHIRIKDENIKAIIKEVMNSGGKLLRPAYALLCSEMGSDYNQKKSVAIAASLETLHMATLIHDDVIDRSEKRRGKRTLHNVYDNKFAIYTGDYLFSVCFSILGKHTDSLSEIALQSRSMEKILLGELSQLHSRYEKPNSVKSYLSRISGKTAQLFALSCYLGAVESGASKRNIRHAWYMGHYIGMAFQIMDDILDYQGDSESLGKPVMADVQQGIYTLPLIYAVLEKPKEISSILKKERPLSDQTMEELLTYINQAMGIEKAERLAERYTNKALKRLEKLPDGSYKDTLRQLTTQLLKRTT